MGLCITERWRRTVSVWALSMPFAVVASNGINLTGYGSESSVMGGADIALARDTTAPGTNPAGLTQIGSRAFDIYATPFVVTDVSHRDSLGNDDGISNPTGLIFGGGWATHRPGSSLHYGIGVFVAAGLGFTYKNLDNVFGTRDVVRSSLGVSKFATAVGWKASERLSLGLSLAPVYSTVQETFLPGISIYNEQSPEQSFYGFNFDKADGVSLNARAGLQYRLNEQLLVATAYSTKTPVRLRDGHLTANYEALGHGIVTYRDARLTGVNLPQEVTLGVRYEPSPRLMWVAELNWLNWDDAINGTVLRARKPNNNNVPDEYQVKSNLDFRDQYVISLGVVQQWSSTTRLRAGLNYARRPIPDKNLSPIFPIIQATHVAAGFSRVIAAGWEAGLGLEYMPLQSVRYDTPGGVFGDKGEERNEAFLFHFMISRRW